MKTIEFAVMKDGIRATTHTTRASAEAWVTIMESAGKSGYTIIEIEAGESNE